MTYRGQYFDVEGAKLFDCPETPPQIGIAVSGPESCNLAGQLADVMIATDPKAELIQMVADAGGTRRPAVGQTAFCWGADESAARKLAWEQFGWALGGWKIQAELPNTVNFEAFVQALTEEQVAAKIPCGPDVSKIVESVKKFVDAGFDEVALVQIGPDQAGFCEIFKRELGPALRAF